MTRSEAKITIRDTRKILEGIVQGKDSTIKEKLDASKILLQTVGAFSEKEFNSKFPKSFGESEKEMMDLGFEPVELELL